MSGAPDIPGITKQQRKTVELLATRLDNLDVQPDPDLPGLVVFAGDGQDGLQVGDISPGGKVTWIVGG